LKIKPNFPLIDNYFSLTGKYFSLTNFSNDKQTQENLESDFSKNYISKNKRTKIKFLIIKKTNHF